MVQVVGTSEKGAEQVAAGGSGNGASASRTIHKDHKVEQMVSGGGPQNGGGGAGGGGSWWNSR